MRNFGAIGHPPERFYKAAVRTTIQPTKENVDELFALRKALSEEERAVLGVSQFERPRTEGSIRNRCRRITDAYMARRRYELTPPSVRRVRQAMLHAGYA